MRMLWRWGSALAAISLSAASLTLTNTDQMLGNDSLRTARLALNNTKGPIASPGISSEDSITVTPPDNGGHDSVAVDRRLLTDGADGTTNAVVQAGDGIQLLTVIKGAEAPESYRYTVDLPPGGSIAVTSDGLRAVVLNGDHKPIGTVDQAWAKDASGVSVGTHYSTDGVSLTQVVNHHSATVTYPIVADPYFHRYWNGYVITLTREDMEALLVGGIAAVPLAPYIIAIPGVNAAYVVALGWIGVYASWAYFNHKCGWIWITLGKPSFGWYDC